MYLHTNLLSVVDVQQRPLSAQPVFAPRLRDCSHGFLSAPPPPPPVHSFTGRSHAAIPGDPVRVSSAGPFPQLPRKDTSSAPPLFPITFPLSPPCPHIQVDKDRLDPPPPPPPTRLIPTRDTIYALPVCVLNTCCSVSDPIRKEAAPPPPAAPLHPFPDTHLPIYLGGQGQTGP